MKRIKDLAGELFDPQLVSALESLARKESFWFDLMSPFMIKRLSELVETMPFAIGPEELRSLAGLFAAVIDAKSPFTYHHSRRVAGVAVFLGEELGLKKEELAVLEVAGLLHDLGKLCVPDEILEKPASLTPHEYNVMKQHVYYTYRILEDAYGLGPIPAWAGYHHEKLDGQGYPFHLKDEQLSLPARIMAVSDIFTALREDRPYRLGMGKQKVTQILTGQSKNGALDTRVVAACLENFERLDSLFSAPRKEDMPADFPEK